VAGSTERPADRPGVWPMQARRVDAKSESYSATFGSAALGLIYTIKSSAHKPASGAASGST